MSRNKFPGQCYRCGERVEIGEGHFERFNGGWRTQHATCAIEHRGTPDPARVALKARWDTYWSKQTGRKAQRARARLRAASPPNTKPEPQVKASEQGRGTQ